MALPRSIFTKTRANRKNRVKRHKLPVHEEEATGRRVSNKLLWSALGSWLTKAGLRDIRFHDLRHTFASLLIQQETTPKYIQKKLGHGNISVTLDIYSHLFRGDHRHHVDRLDDAQVLSGKTRGRKQ